MNPGDPTGLAAHACGRGMAPATRREDVALTVREAVWALRDGADVHVELPILEAGRPLLVTLSRLDVLRQLEGIDGDDSTRLYPNADGDLRLEGF